MMFGGNETNWNEAVNEDGDSDKEGHFHSAMELDFSQWINDFKLNDLQAGLTNLQFNDLTALAMLKESDVRELIIEHASIKSLIKEKPILLSQLLRGLKYLQSRFSQSAAITSMSSLQSHHSSIDSYNSPPFGGINGINGMNGVAMTSTRMINNHEYAHSLPDFFGDNNNMNNSNNNNNNNNGLPLPPSAIDYYNNNGNSNSNSNKSMNSMSYTVNSPMSNLFMSPVSTPTLGSSGNSIGAINGATTNGVSTMMTQTSATSATCSKQFVVVSDTENKVLTMIQQVLSTINSLQTQLECLSNEYKCNNNVNNNDSNNNNNKNSNSNRSSLNNNSVMAFDPSNINLFISDASSLMIDLNDTKSDDNSSIGTDNSSNTNSNNDDNDHSNSNDNNNNNQPRLSNFSQFDSQANFEYTSTYNNNNNNNNNSSNIVKKMGYKTGFDSNFERIESKISSFYNRLHEMLLNDEKRLLDQIWQLKCKVNDKFDERFNENMNILKKEKEFLERELAKYETYFNESTNVHCNESIALGNDARQDYIVKLGKKIEESTLIIVDNVSKDVSLMKQDIISMERRYGFELFNNKNSNNNKTNVSTNANKNDIFEDEYAPFRRIGCLINKSDFQICIRKMKMLNNNRNNNNNNNYNHYLNGKIDLSNEICLSIGYRQSIGLLDSDMISSNEEISVLPVKYEIDYKYLINESDCKMAENEEEKDIIDNGDFGDAYSDDDDDDFDNDIEDINSKWHKMEGNINVDQVTPRDSLSAKYKSLHRCSNGNFVNSKNNNNSDCKKHGQSVSLNCMSPDIVISLNPFDDSNNSNNSNDNEQKEKGKGKEKPDLNNNDVAVFNKRLKVIINQPKSIFNEKLFNKNENNDYKVLCKIRLLWKFFLRKNDENECIGSFWSDFSNEYELTIPIIAKNGTLIVERNETCVLRSDYRYIFDNIIIKQGGTLTVDPWGNNKRKLSKFKQFKQQRSRRQSCLTASSARGRVVNNNNNNNGHNSNSGTSSSSSSNSRHDTPKNHRKSPKYCGDNSNSNHFTRGQRQSQITYKNKKRKSSNVDHTPKSRKSSNNSIINNNNNKKKKASFSFRSNSVSVGIELKQSISSPLAVNHSQSSRGGGGSNDHVFEFIDEKLSDECCDTDCNQNQNENNGGCESPEISVIDENGSSETSSNKKNGSKKTPKYRKNNGDNATPKRGKSSKKLSDNKKKEHKGGRLLIECLNSIIIENHGCIDVTGCGYNGGSFCNNGESSINCKGGGIGGANGGCGAGGAGYGTCGTNGSKTNKNDGNNEGGMTYGDKYLTVLHLGSGGGGGERGKYKENQNGGGNGGGCVSLKCKELVIHEKGQIIANGNNGHGMYGGGGSGGSIYLDVFNKIENNGKMEAIGGKGGSHHSHFGGNGGNGRIRINLNNKNDNNDNLNLLKVKPEPFIG